MLKFKLWTLFYFTSLWAIVAGASQFIGMRALICGAAATVMGLAGSFLIGTRFDRIGTTISAGTIGSLTAYTAFVVYHLFAQEVFRGLPFHRYITSSSELGWACLALTTALAGVVPTATISASWKCSNGKLVARSTCCSAFASSFVVLIYAIVLGLLADSWTTFPFFAVFFYTIPLTLIGAVWGMLVALAYVLLKTALRKKQDEISNGRF